MTDWSEGDHYNLSFAINKSRRYHSLLRAHYQSLHDLSTAISAIAGSGTFIALLKSDVPLLAKWLAGFVAVSTTLDTVFRFSKKASLHDGLSRRFTELAASIEGLEPNDVNLARVSKKRILIEKDEPPEKTIVNLIAQNDEARARGVADHDLFDFTLLERLLGRFFAFNVAGIVRRRDLKRARPSLFVARPDGAT